MMQLATRKQIPLYAANAGTGTSSDSETDTGFALPNKLGGAEYPTTKKTLSTSGNSGTNGTADSNSETIYNDEFIQLKNEYMAQIRDLYYEFAGQFAPMFHPLAFLKGEI